MKTLILILLLISCDVQPRRVYVVTSISPDGTQYTLTEPSQEDGDKIKSVKTVKASKGEYKLGEVIHEIHK